MKEFNINDYVKVKLTKEGETIYTCHYRDIGIEPIKVPKDLDGFTNFQLWNLLQIFGQHIGMCTVLPFETTIQIDEKDLKEKGGQLWHLDTTPLEEDNGGSVIQSPTD